MAGWLAGWLAHQPGCNIARAPASHASCTDPSGAGVCRAEDSGLFIAKLDAACSQNALQVLDCMHAAVLASQEDLKSSMVWSSGSHLCTGPASEALLRLRWKAQVCIELPSAV